MLSKGPGVLMALQPQRMSIPIVGGQEQSIASELVDPPLLTVAQNVIYERQGELKKRRGWVRSYETLNGLTYLPHCERLATRGNEIVWIGEQVVDQCEPREELGISSRLPAETNEVFERPVWTRKGDIARWNVSTLAEISSPEHGARVLSFDCAFAGDLLAEVGNSGVIGVVWQCYDVEKLFFAAIDVATGAILVSRSLAVSVATDEPIRIVAMRGSGGLWYFHVYYTSTELGESCHLYYLSIPAANPFTTTASTLISDDVQAWDVCCTGPTGLGIDPTWTHERRLFVCYAMFSTANVYLNLYIPDSTGTLIYKENNTVSMGRHVAMRTIAGQLGCCCDPDGRFVWAHVATSWTGPGYSNEAIRWQLNEGPWAAPGIIYFDSSAEITTANASHGNPIGVHAGWRGTSVVAAVTRYDNVIFTWSRDATGRTDVAEYTANSTAGSMGNISSSYSCAYSPWGRHWNYHGRDYWPVVRGHSPDAKCVEFVAAGQPIVDAGEIHVSTGRAVQGLIAYPTAAAASRVLLSGGRNSTVESWYQRGRFFSVYPTMGLDSTEMKLTVLDISAVEKEMFGWADTPAGLYFSGSIPWCYDGGPGHELGFVHRPQSTITPDGEIVTGIQVAVGTPWPIATYWLALCWEHTDQLGRVSRSAPSIRSVEITAANQSAFIQYQTLGFTSHSQLRPVLYAADANGLNYFRSTQVIPNDPSPTTESIQVNIAWGNLFVAGAPTLYTSQGILENSPPPQARVICYWGNRIWYANQRSVWFSREIIDAEEPSFNEALSFQVPMNVTALASLDDRMVIFGENEIYVISGDGPTDTGEGGTFTTPQRIRGEVGCVDPRSVVRVGNNVLFQSKRGIESFDGMQSKVISSGVDWTMKDGGYTEIVSASYDSTNQIARFLAKSGFSYLVFCWHSAFELWTTATIPRISTSPNTTVVPVGIVSAFDRNWMSINDSTRATAPIPKNAIAREIGRTENYAYGQFVDGYPDIDGYEALFWYQSTVEFADIKFDGLQGFQRIWRFYLQLRDSGAETGIELSYICDYSSPRITKTWTTVPEIATGIAAPALFRRYAVHVAKQQSSAIRVRFRDLLRTDGGVDEDISKNTGFTLISLGLEYGIKPGTGRGSSGSKK